VLLPPSTGEHDATRGDDDGLPGSSVAAFADLYDEEVPGFDAKARDSGAGAKELVSRLHHQFVRERNQLARRGGVDRFTLRDGSVKMHGHDEPSLVFGTQSDL